MKASLSIRRLQSSLVNNRLAKRDVRRSLLACLICLALTSGLIPLSVSAKTRKRPVKAAVVKPAVTSVQSMEAKGDADSRVVSIEIGGKGFGNDAADDKVTLIDVISGDDTEATVTIAGDDLIIARAEVPRGDSEARQWLVKLEIKGKTVDTGRARIKLAAIKAPPAKVRNIDVSHTSFNNPVDPTSHSLLVTPTDDDEQFSTDPSKMSVQILPPGATKITIEPAISPKKMLVTFNAPQDFEVKDLFVISSDGSTAPKVAADADKPAKQPAHTIKINRVDVLSLQRRDGFGRIKIEGEGFGDHEAPPQNGEVELLCDKANRSYHVDERADTHSSTSKIDTSSVCSTADFNAIKGWRDKIAKELNVVIVPRNPDFRIERTLIMYVNDKVLDVYFEFSHWEWVSEPFRLDGVTVSLTREEPSAAPADTQASAHHASGAETPVKSNKTTTYLASHDIGPPRDTNLEYRYTVLDEKDAAHLLGSGVAQNFYVIQLSVVNKGDKKVIVPLSSIQAEIEWTYGSENDEVSYDEGPATLSPMALPDISSYFSLFQKTKGKRARLFNVLDGVLTLSASLVPVFGRNLERSNSIMSGGLIPGLKKSFGDLSSEQLQNLTSRSWDDVEEIAASGGSKEKYVYIQRSDQSFSRNPKIIKEIKSIAGLEVSGFVVKESSPASAVRQP